MVLMLLCRSCRWMACAGASFSAADVAWPARRLWPEKLFAHGLAFLAPRATFAKVGCSVREGPMDVEALSAKPRLRLLLDHFAKIKDTRQSWKVAYPLQKRRPGRRRAAQAIAG
jgi:hypothetical protein